MHASPDSAVHDQCDARDRGDVSDVSRRHAASVNVPAKLTSVGDHADPRSLGPGPRPHPARRRPSPPLVPRPGRRRPGPHPRPALGPDADLLEAAAWLHDIGYHPDLADTGLHGLDGARYLRDQQHADPMLCRLVAHHSCAVIEADERGLAHVLTREFAPPPQPWPTR